MSFFFLKKKRMSENGTCHITVMKNWVSHVKGTYRIPGSAEKGGYSGRTSVLCYPPPPKKKKKKDFFFKFSHKFCLSKLIYNIIHFPAFAGKCQPPAEFTISMLNMDLLYLERKNVDPNQLSS